jgi:hypothetical protein
MQDEFVSKTKRKQEMHELQALGVALVALSESQLQDMSRSARGWRRSRAIPPRPARTIAGWKRGASA